MASNPTKATGSSGDNSSSRASRADHHPTRLRQATSTSPTASTGRPLINVPAANSHKFNGDVAVFDDRSANIPQ